MALFFVLAAWLVVLSVPRPERPRGQRSAASLPAPVPDDGAASGAAPRSRLEEPVEPASPTTSPPGTPVEGPRGAPSARGLSLAYRYRPAPPGEGSGYQWMVWLAGPREVLDRVEVVTWTMDPPPRNGGEMESRGRAADGFPLFGDGPGGWFGISATVRYGDGSTERLTGRVELPEPA